MLRSWHNSTRSRNWHRRRDGARRLGGAARRGSRAVARLPVRAGLAATADIATYARVALASGFAGDRPRPLYLRAPGRQAAGPSRAAAEGRLMRIPFLARPPREFSIEPLSRDSRPGARRAASRGFRAALDRRRVRAAAGPGHGVRLCRPRDGQGQGRPGRLRAGAAGRRRGRDPDAGRGAQPSPRRGSAGS